MFSAIGSTFFCPVFITTDNFKIIEHCKTFGAACVLINEFCVNGTERVAKCLQTLNMDCDLVLNVQGDEPFINPDDIDLLITNYQNNKYILITINYYL